MYHLDMTALFDRFVVDTPAQASYTVNQARALTGPGIEQTFSIYDYNGNPVINLHNTNTPVNASFFGGVQLVGSPEELDDISIDKATFIQQAKFTNNNDGSYTVTVIMGAGMRGRFSIGVTMAAKAVGLMDFTIIDPVMGFTVSGRPNDTVNSAMQQNSLFAEMPTIQIQLRDNSQPLDGYLFFAALCDQSWYKLNATVGRLVDDSKYASVLCKSRLVGSQYSNPSDSTGKVTWNDPKTNSTNELGPMQSQPTRHTNCAYSTTLTPTPVCFRSVPVKISP
eukprot:TRINITY_DN5932_c0_g1_i3.p1 TRINITY_DN5932_c0_g1~~TRINITY_DN5932_c0_g1_i3.p1  ORF type:complete len:280 (-),score=20.46 TRINITY_DN5932_c0_g1_i3:228-1067(-)